MRKSIFKNQRGFSLIELMVVVAIIGILAVIAIPNYQRFQRQSRQVEAKSMLSGIYTAEMAFVAQFGVGTPNLPQMGFEPKGNVVYDAGWAATQTAAAGVANPNQLTKAAIGNSYTGPVATNVTHVSTHKVASVVLGAEKESADSTQTLSLDEYQSAINPSCTDTVNCQLNQQQTGCDNKPGKTCGNNNYNAGTASTPGSTQLRNVGPGRVEFRIGAKGNIGGSTDDVWTMTQDKLLVNDQSGID